MAFDHPDRHELSSLADVRDLVEKHLPAPYRHKATWRHVSSEIAKAAEGEKDLLEICVSLRHVLALESGDSARAVLRVEYEKLHKSVLRWFVKMRSVVMPGV